MWLWRGHTYTFAPIAEGGVVLLQEGAWAWKTWAPSDSHISTRAGEGTPNMTKEQVDQAIEAYVQERIDPVQTDLESALAQVETNIRQISALQTSVNELTEENLDLRTRLEAYEPPKPKTLMGVSVNGAVRRDYIDLSPAVAVSRVYAGNTASWNQEDQHKVFPDSMWACSNTVSLSLSGLDALLGSIPDADKAKIVAWCDVHEPEHPDKKLVAADYKKRMQQSAGIIRSHGLKVASCVMGFSVPNDVWLQWIDPTVVDILAFDKYNAGAKKTPPIYQDPNKLVENLVQQSTRFGKPWALWETGTDQFGTDTDRIVWTTALRKAIEDNNGVHAIWFDRTSTSGSTWSALLQPQAAAEAWLL